MKFRKSFVVGLIATIVAAIQFAGAEQLPLKIYTTADGLASDLIRFILCDSQGFLWFGTSDGISRFDGYEFTHLTTADGLPGTDVRSIVEARDGTYWAATNAGIFHWDPAGGTSGSHRSPPNVIHVAIGQPADEVLALLEDRSGVFWAATQGGLYSLERRGDAWKVGRLPLESSERPESAAVYALREDPDGSLWIGSDGGLFRRSPSGAVERIRAKDGSPHSVRSLLREPHGSLWAGSHTEGLFEIQNTAAAAGTAVRRAFSRDNGLPGNYVSALFETSDGKIWAGCFPGVSEIAIDRTSVRSYTTAEGLPAIGIFALAEDRNGNLWLGSDDGGVMKLGHDGFRRFDARDGLASTCVDSLFENRDGQLCAFTRGTRAEDIAVDRSFVECFDGVRFHAQKPPLRHGVSFGWGMSQLVLQDRHREWWIPSLGGLYRFPAVPFSRLGSVVPRRIYTERDGLPSSQLFRLFEDAAGNIWAGLAAGERPLAVWNRATESFRSFSLADGIPRETPVAFAQDLAGSVWI